MATYPYDRLSTMDPAELQSIWQACLQGNQTCCEAHARYDAEPEDQEKFDIWMQAVQSELLRRGLPTARVREPFNCPGCGGQLQTISGEYGAVYVDCHTCRTRRRLGDHMNCALGSPERLPTAA